MLIHICAAQVIAPYDAEDARGLLKASIRDPDPVVFLENEILYGEAFPVSEAVLDKDFTLPIGKAKAWTSTSSNFVPGYSKFGYFRVQVQGLGFRAFRGNVNTLDIWETLPSK